MSEKERREWTDKFVYFHAQHNSITPFIVDAMAVLATERGENEGRNLSKTHERVRILSQSSLHVCGFDDFNSVVQWITSSIERDAE